MADKQNNIKSRDSNLSPRIYNILNEAYHEFREMYGDKHSNHIKILIESMTDKVKKSQLYYCGPIAVAIPQVAVQYTESDNLSGILKHEFWHVYNDVGNDREKGIEHIPQRYIDKLRENGYLEKLYTQKMSYYKEVFKNDPERLKKLTIDFEEFIHSKIDLGAHTCEMWTEWFNNQTHLKDMKYHFWDWGDGYFVRRLSTGSFYDCYLNIASMISCLIPKEKLLEMYLQTQDYQTDYSFPQMLEDFDQEYSNALVGEEAKKYQFPYLKILMDIKNIEDNARENPQVAFNSLQSCMKTCFNAYLQKMESIKHIDLEQAKQLYSEIKYMQEHMVWNLDMSKMRDLDYIQTMCKIQDKFKLMMKGLNLENPEVSQMLESIDYTEDNAFKYIEDGEKISKKITNTQKEDRTSLVSVGSSYKIHVGKNGVKDNLYRTLFVILGEKKYNYLFKNGENSKDNLLLKFYRQIEEATTDEEFINIYNSIYEIYLQRLESTLKIDENLESKFNKYSKEIVELQKNGMFDEKNKGYLPGLEKIIETYNEKANAYLQEIDRVTEEIIQEEMKERRSSKVIQRSTQDARKYKEKLIGQKNRLIKRRENQALQYIELGKTYIISTQTIR